MKYSDSWILISDLLISYKILISHIGWILISDLIISTIFKD